MGNDEKVEFPAGPGTGHGKDRDMWYGQRTHVVGNLILALGLFAVSRHPAVGAGALGGAGTPLLIGIAFAVCVLHHFSVVFFWRGELHHGAVSKLFGRERGFRIWGILFFVLFASRFATVALVSVANTETVAFPPVLRAVVAVVLGLPALWTIVSAFAVFGVRRALGEDHWDPATYRASGFVGRGVFRYVPNAMYTLGMLAMFLPGVIAGSAAGLTIGLVNYVAIWLHYHCTEKPDLQHIYG